METNADYTKPLDLTEIRGKIDKLDDELAALFVHYSCGCASFFSLSVKIQEATVCLRTSST